MSTASVGGPLRRYPALGFLAVSGVLATLLPSALRIPLSGPSALAELAPVPGKSDGAGDLSALGESSTGGLGSGSGVGGDGSGGAGGDGGFGGPPPGGGGNPRDKRCVGSPARQTEDPWSPTCVGFFKGDNFGATAKGVSGEEIRVVVVGNCRSDGSYDIIDFADGSHGADQEAAYVRYFNERFQTYDRKVHVFKADASDSVVSCGAVGPSVVQRIDEALDPFLIFRENEFGLTEPMAAEAARLGIMSMVAGPARAFAQRHAPYVMSFAPDLEDLTANMVEAVCARFAGRPARFAGDPSMHGMKRKLGVWYSRGQADPSNQGAGLLTEGISRRCGREAGPVETYYATGSGRSEEDAFTDMRVEGVTTVLALGAGLADFTRADAAKWYPEWLLADEFMVGDNGTSRLNAPPTVMRGFIGLMERRRLGTPAEQFHRQARAEACPDCNSFASEYLYNMFLLVYTGIQSAGPRLTPANVDRGLHALPARQSRDPFVPSAYFAPGNHSFVKDFAVVWWDGTGHPPNSCRPGVGA